MRATEELMTEHRAIEVMLRVLEVTAERLEAEQDVPVDDLAQMLDFIRGFADRCHHGKEEDLLFAELERAGLPREGGPVAVMLLEHDQGRGHVRRMAEAVARWGEDRNSAATQFAQAARAYVDLLRQHIQKEDHILYPLADAHLSPQQQEQLLRGFAQIEEERVGPGQHEAYHRLLERLQVAYLEAATG